MKSILVATDFSPAATNAARYAADMAMAINAKLWLLNIYQIPVVYMEAPVIVNDDEMMKEAEKKMKLLKEELDWHVSGKIEIETEVTTGVFFEELKHFCEKTGPYTVVMGSQGTSKTERLLFGGHTVHAMKHLSWPLITVPPEASFSAVKKIGLACDFDKVVDTTPIDEIKKLVTDFNAELHVLNTGKEKVFDPDIIYESGLLQEMLMDLKPNYHFITHQDVDAGIMEFSEKNQIDLLVVLPKRHGLLEQLIHKSHTKKLVLHSHVPVMALHFN